MGLKRASFEKAIPAGDRILIDTSVFISYFEPADSTHVAAVVVIDEFVRSGRNAAVASMVTVMELFVQPLRVAPISASHVQAFLTQCPNLTLQAIDMPVAQEAASLRATHNFATPDALIVGTGIVAQVGHLVTNDHKWSTKLARIAGRIQVTELTTFI